MNTQNASEQPCRRHQLLAFVYAISATLITFGVVLLAYDFIFAIVDFFYQSTDPGNTGKSYSQSDIITIFMLLYEAIIGIIYIVILELDFIVFLAFLYFSKGIYRGYYRSIVKRPNLNNWGNGYRFFHLSLLFILYYFLF